MSFAARKGTRLNVHTFPRPPALERVDNRHLRVVLADGTVLADSHDAYWVLETTHPPTYYIPRRDVDMSLLKRSARTSYCEWKGRATYYIVSPPQQQAPPVVDRCWSYDDPTPAFREIAGHVSFYVGPWACYVDGERVEAQPGDFYGGWMTKDIDGGSRGVKGGPGTWGW